VRKKKDGGLKELLRVMQAHPELIRDLVFDLDGITKLLRSRSARRLIRGYDVDQFLMRMGEAGNGSPLSQCYFSTQSLCGKGTIACVGATTPLPTCPGNTKTLPTCPGNTKTLPTCPGNTKTLLS
jgi:hypothetical protein